MRRRGGSKKIGCGIVLLGVFIILAMLLPTGFWWFVLGGVLIIAGFWCLRCW